MKLAPEAILFIPLACVLAVTTGDWGYEKFIANRNSVAFNVQAKTKDGYDVNVQAKASSFGKAGSDFASDAEKAYVRTTSETEMRSAMSLVVLQDVANHACQFNKNDLSGTFIQEANGASFSHLTNAYSFQGVTKISIPADEQVQLIGHCVSAPTPQT